MCENDHMHMAVWCSHSGRLSSCIRIISKQYLFVLDANSFAVADDASHGARHETSGSVEADSEPKTNAVLTTRQVTQASTDDAHVSHVVFTM